MLSRPSWRTLSMRQVMAEFYDGPHATPPAADDGPIYLGIGNLREDGLLDLGSIRHISEADYGQWTRRVEPRAGDLVFTYEASLHRYAILPEGFRGCLGRRTALIRPDPEVVDTRFLLYSFLSPEWRQAVQQRVNVGSTVDRIPLADFPNFPITLPSLTTQRRITAILSAYDDLIENNTRRIQILEEMAQAIYREWFVEFRFPGHEGVRMVGSERGPIPDGWRAAGLSTEITLEYGRALKENDRAGGSIPVVGSSGVVGYHREALVHGPGIVIGRKGNAGSITWIDSDFFPIDTTFYVETNHDLLFVYYQLREIPWVTSDTAVPGLSRRQAYAESFLYPPSGIEAAFARVAAPIRDLVRNLHQSTTALRQTRDLLLPRLISGEIDVSNLDVGNAEPAA